MGQRPPQPPPPPRAAPRWPPPPPLLPLLLVVLVANSIATAAAHSHGLCDLEACTGAYDVSLESRGLAGPEGSAAFCGVLYDFGACMYNIRRACRGNLRYHTSNSMLIHLKTSYDCGKRLQQTKPRPPPAPTAAPRTTTTTTTTTTASPPGAGAAAVPECSYRGGRGGGAFRHCGLFGDPHLKTFRGAMQTCRVQGAWPLVDNPYLAVQVTNEHVLPGSPATATTKVTVLVKGSSTPCTTQKIYEATADAPLPDTFIDGTNKSGPGEPVTVRHSQTAYGASVEIQIRYIEATVIVRKVGRYLAFSTRMPEELALWRGQDGDVDGEGQGAQLCVQGCPLSERMDLANDRGHVLSWADALAKCVDKTPAAIASSAPEAAPLSAGNELADDLTDQYLDWCVFDLMTTGREDFVLAARSAHRDTLDMDPVAAHNLRNRTTAQDVGAGAGAGVAASTKGAAAAAAAAPALLPLLLCALVLALALPRAGR